MDTTCNPPASSLFRTLINQILTFSDTLSRSMSGIRLGDSEIYVSK